MEKLLERVQEAPGGLASTPTTGTDWRQNAGVDANQPAPRGLKRGFGDTLLSLQVALVVTLSAVSCRSAQQGLVARYDFDEGSGSLLHDLCGNGIDGTIHGAHFVKCGVGHALSFDGVDDYVAFPATKSLDITDVITVGAWVKPEALPGFGEPGVVGKGYESYVLTYYQDGGCWWYISGGPNNCKANVPLGSWHHVVGTFDGRKMRLYVDGELRDERTATVSKIDSGKEAFLGKSSGTVQYTQNAHFKGQIDDVEIFNRALSEEEVRKEFQTTHLTGEVETASKAYPFGREMGVYLNLRGLGNLPPGASVEVGLYQPGKPKPLQTRKLQSVRSGATLDLSLSVGDLKSGEYEVRVAAKDPKGQQVGNPSVESVTWPKKATWRKAAPGAKALNNLVTQLLNVKPKASDKELTFTNPRDGWVYVSSRAEVVGEGQLSLFLNSSEVGGALTCHKGGTGDQQEAMRFVPAGKQTIRVESTGRASLKQVVVRAVPELIYCQFPSNPLIRPHGPYDWEFLKKDVLPNANCIIAHHSDDYRPYVEEWKNQGRKWVISSPVPGIDGSEVSPERAFDYWSQNAGADNPLYDGIIADEFGGGNIPQYDGWTEGLRRLFADPKFKGKTFYPWCATMYGAEKSRKFIQLVMDNGSRFAFERYLNEQPSETVARRHLESSLSMPARDWEKAQPGAVGHMIVTLGYMSAPNETLNINPSVDYKVYMDLQFNLLANDPTFFGLYGVMEYLSSYADEESVRWAGRLYRHYGIEGKTNLLSEEYGFRYELGHLQNPDFADRLQGWTVDAADRNSIATKMMQGFSWLEGRYPPVNQGNTFLWMKRSGSQPNRVSQVLRGLQPGKTYSLKLVVADYGDLTQGKSVKEQHAFSVALNSVEKDPKRTFTHAIDHCYSHDMPPFNRDHKAWMNYHFCVFRAKGREAKLTIADWTSDTDPGGPVGQELMLNFVEVQPYLE
ncbi:MAG: LamG domain-containing protein [Armatimonadetes bacterium]|nr:LamG domain-containing protein [Armatimonadota bacterium]